MRTVPVAPAPAPWRPVPPVFVGGLTEIGIDTSRDGVDLVLVVSHGGRGVVSTDGQVVARDRTEMSDDWYDPSTLTATGIGPLAGNRVRLAGLAGGGLPVGTADGWQITRYPVDWPDERVILEPPHASVIWTGHEAGCVTLLHDDIHEVRTVGFTPSGRLLVIATSGALYLYTRGTLR